MDFVGIDVPTMTMTKSGCSSIHSPPLKVSSEGEMEASIVISSSTSRTRWSARGTDGALLLATTLFLGCLHVPERPVREHEVQDASLGMRIRVGETEGVIVRGTDGSWPVLIEQVQRFEQDVSRFAMDVPLSERPDRMCGVNRRALLLALQTHVRQYVPYTDAQGRQRLHVSFLQRATRGWKSSLSFGIDQGLDAFSVEYDAGTRKVETLETSGCA